MSLISNPPESGDEKNLLQEWIVLPGFKSSKRLDSGPKSVRNLSCSWLLHKISLLNRGCDGWNCCDDPCNSSNDESVSFKSAKKNWKEKCQFICNLSSMTEKRIVEYSEKL